MSDSEKPVAEPVVAEQPTRSPDAPLKVRLGWFVRAVRDADDAEVERMLMRVSRRRRWLAPLALVVGALVILFDGLRLLFSNWRLTLVQILPAMWIWLAMFDLKLHVLHGRSFNVVRGPVLIPVVLAIVAITAASFFLNAVFGFAIIQSGVPQVRPAFDDARSRMTPIVVSGTAVGALLAFATVIVTRWGHPWFAISLSAAIGVMMVAYVAVPSRLIGVKPQYSTRDKLTTSAVGGALGAVVCTPPYALSRIGILMLGTPILFVPGLILTFLGAALSAGATSAVKAVKMSAKLGARDAP
jgi:hypothetical protein